MTRIPISLLAVLVTLFWVPVLSQNAGGQIVRPGGSTGAQVPGMPPSRDSRALPQTGTARLRGRVVAAQTGNPLRRAQVTIFAVESPVVRRATTTDGEGRYEFADLPAGRFSVSATKAGYVQLQFGQRRPFETGTPVMVAEGEEVQRIDFSLPRGSVIAVRVTDDFGEPLAGAQVQVQRYQYGPDGQRRLTSASTGVPFSGTDDRGEIRMFGLMPGDYIVSATMRSTPLTAGPAANDSSEGFSPTFYPGTINPAEAQAIIVAVGQETSVQLSLVTARMARVSGTVVDSEGRPAAGAQLSVVTRQATSMSSSGAGMVAPDGSFSIVGVAPGEHSIDVVRRLARG